MNIIVTTILLCFVSFISLGQSSGGGYVIDIRTGCKVWTDYHSPSVSASWSGDCKDKLATGFGTLVWFYEGKETAQYVGNMQQGNPHGNGKYSWSNGYVQEGNYFQGQFLNLDGDYLKRVEKNALAFPDKNDLYVGDGESRSLFYYALVPKDKITGTLILLSGSSESASSVFTNNVKLAELACDKGLLVIVPSINNNLLLGDHELSFFNGMFENVLAKYKVPKDKIIIGGFSLGGLYALRYSEMANDSNFKTAIKPVAVFAADPPVDIAWLYDVFQREIDRNAAESAVAECKRYIKLLETSLGGSPSSRPEKYRSFSAFSRHEKDGGNLVYLKSIPVRIYSDPDIDWQMKTRKSDYFDMGALDQTTMINMLNRLGNTKAEFKNALGKGFNLDGSRNPHAWSIIDAPDCISWMMNCLN
jgi:hypothetical protein